MDRKKKYVWGIIIIIIILLLPLVLGWLIPKQSFIEDFTESNDWIGFWGSYIGAIVTLVVLWFTRKDTRKIQGENAKLQKKLLKIEEENQLRECRTFFIEGTVKNNFRINKDADFFKGGLLITNNHYNDIIKEIEKLCSDEILGDIYKSREAKLKLNQLEEYDELNYKFLKNIGNNPMFNVTVEIEGAWYIPENRSEDETLKFSIDCIEKDTKVFLPLFRWLDGERITSFDIFKMRVVYDVGQQTNLSIERFFIDFKYSKEDAKVSREIRRDTITKSEICIYDYNDHRILM